MSPDQWAQKWGVPPQAMRELIETMTVSSAATDASETAVQANLRMRACEAGWRLWRNNVGSLPDKRGVPVRYGLCNESKKMNDALKSSDLIGIRPVFITTAHVGRTIGQFVSIEVKKGGWRPCASKREQAQARWLTLITSLGGCAAFSTGELPT